MQKPEAPQISAAKLKDLQLLGLVEQADEAARCGRAGALSRQLSSACQLTRNTMAPTSGTLVACEQGVGPRLPAVELPRHSCQQGPQLRVHELQDAEGGLQAHQVSRATPLQLANPAVMHLLIKSDAGVSAGWCLITWKLGRSQRNGSR